MVEMQHQNTGTCTIGGTFKKRIVYVTEDGRTRPLATGDAVKDIVDLPQLDNCMCV